MLSGPPRPKAILYLQLHMHLYSDAKINKHIALNLSGYSCTPGAQVYIILQWLLFLLLFLLLAVESRCLMGIFFCLCMSRDAPASWMLGTLEVRVLVRMSTHSASNPLTSDGLCWFMEPARTARSIAINSSCQFNITITFPTDCSTIILIKQTKRIIL